jgi:hypothetical protein
MLPPKEESSKQKENLHIPVTLAKFEYPLNLSPRFS